MQLSFEDLPLLFFWGVGGWVGGWVGWVNLPLCRAPPQDFPPSFGLALAFSSLGSRPAAGLGGRHGADLAAAARAPGLGAPAGPGLLGPLVPRV